MKFGVVNKSTILNRFVLHTLQRNITHLAVITRKTNIKLGILKGGDWKRAKSMISIFGQPGQFVNLAEHSSNITRLKAEGLLFRPPHPNRQQN